MRKVARALPGGGGSRFEQLLQLPALPRVSLPKVLNRAVRLHGPLRKLGHRLRRFPSQPLEGLAAEARFLRYVTRDCWYLPRVP